jgi:hypothetical protein
MNPHDDTSPRGRIARALGALLSSARRTPAEVGAGLALAVAFCACLNHGGHAIMESFARAALSGALFILAAFALSALHAIGALSGKARAGLTAGVGVLLAGYGALVLDLDAAAELWRWALLFAAGCLGVALTPLARRGDALTTRARLWSFNARLVFACASAGALLGFLFLGLALGLVAVDELLGVDVDGEWFGYLFGAIAFGLTPWVVAANLPHIAAAAGPRAERTIDDAIAPYLGALVTALALPVTGLYVAILYVYNALFLLGGAEAPKNMMSPLALGASALAIFCALIADELGRHASTRHALAARAARWVVVAAAGLMPLTAWAILIRVDQYGWTSFRYVRMLAVGFVCVCGLIAAVHALTRRPQPVAEMMLAAAAACVLGSASPWGAVEVSRRAQLGRLVQAAELHGRLHDGVLVPCEGACHINDDLRRQVGYVLREFGPRALAPMLPSSVEVTRDTQHWQLMEDLGWNNGVKRVDPYEGAPAGYAYRDGNRTTLPHGGVELETFHLTPGEAAPVVAGQELALVLGAHEDHLKLGGGGCEATGAFPSLTAWEREHMRLREAAAIPLYGHAGAHVATFLPEYVTQRQMTGDRWRVETAHGRLILIDDAIVTCHLDRLPAE